MSYVDKLTISEKAKYRINNSVKLEVDSKKSILRSGEIYTCEKGISFEGEYDVVCFYNCYFKSIIFKGCVAKQVIINNCFVDNSFLIHEVSITDLLQLQITVGQSLIIRNSDVNRLESYVDDTKKIIIQLAKIPSAVIKGRKDAIIDELNISYFQGKLELGYMSITKFSLRGSDLKSDYIFDCIRILTCIIDSIRNYQDFRIFNFEALDGHSKFEIRDSYLGKAEFYDVDFESFNTVTIVRTHLTDCSFIDVDWNFKMNTVYDVNNDEHSSRETFRQLKYALGKQGDTINEQKFHILEMKTYLKSLDLKNWKNWGTYLIIKLSDVTSDFGQSLGKPFGWLLLGHLGLFLIAMLVKLSSVHISLTNPSLSALNTAIYEYFYLINPLHKTEDLPKDWTIIIDIFMRIWSSYMIYNIIRASRRFIK